MAASCKSSAELRSPHFVTEDKSVIDFPMDGAPSEGCSTTTILAQLSIEPDAGAGAVHTITLTSRRQEMSSLTSQFMLPRGQLCRRACHEPVHSMVGECQVPEPASLVSFPVTVATWWKRLNVKRTLPCGLI
jgi:hypothetical protein